jgi:hypothetical protein
VTARDPASFAREADRITAQADHERYAIEHGMVNDPQPERVQVSSDPSPQEWIGLLGGPDNAAGLAPELPAIMGGGVRQIDMDEFHRQQFLLARFYAQGGGRLPREFQPQQAPPQPPPRINPRVLKELQEDGITVIGLGA